MIQINDNTNKLRLILSTGDSSQTKIGNSLWKGILYEKIPGVKFDH